MAFALLPGQSELGVRASTSARRVGIGVSYKEAKCGFI